MVVFDVSICSDICTEWVLSNSFQLYQDKNQLHFDNVDVLFIWFSQCSLPETAFRM